MVIILDGVGCGELPDAADFGDAGSNTLGNLAEAMGGLNLPNLGRLGLGNIVAIRGIPPAEHPTGAYGKMAEFSPGKDSTVGHWELMGHPVEKPFPTYPEGFPDDIVKRLRAETGRDFIGNKAASGTEIIAELGDEHLRTGSLILYTSADSVLQIAAHEDLVSVEELYRVCGIARRVMSGGHSVGRIIARPFLGESGNFRRTDRRHDFSLKPPGNTTLDLLKNAGIPTISVGKIYDLFGGKGFSESHPTKSNLEGIETTIRIFAEVDDGFVFTNLVDFDMLWGHRNNPEGFYGGLKEFDEYLPEIMSVFKDKDLLILTADHGVDPTTVSTDHSREYVPLLVWGGGSKAGVNLGTRKTFADVGATIADYFGIEGTAWGESFLKLLR